MSDEPQPDIEEIENKKSFIATIEERKPHNSEVLTEDIYRKVNACLKTCMSINGTCKYVGISRATWYLWKQKAEKNKEQVYVEFFKMVEQALGYAEFRLLVEIQKDTSWQAKHSILKRRFNKDWGDKQEVELKAKSTVSHNFTGMSLEEKKKLLIEIVKAEKEAEPVKDDTQE